jgi:MFS family permease
VAFVRDPVTFLAYGSLAAFSYCLYALGPILAFLHDELRLSYTVTSLHSTMWSAGRIATGLLYARLACRLGRQRLFWLSAAATATGVLLLASSRVVGLTLLTTGLLGTAGTLLQTGTSTVLSDRHGERRGRALIEANIGASAAAVLAPIALGVLHGTPAGWRAGLLVPAIGIGVLFLLFGRVQLPIAPPPPEDGRRRSQLHLEYWMPALLVATTVGVEFCIVFYGAPLLQSQTAIRTASAATILSVFFVGGLLGRILGSQLIRPRGRTVMLVLGSLGVTTGGFLVLWLSEYPLYATIGLFIAGLGVANLYPLTLALAVAAAPGRTDQIVGRVQLLVGCAVAIAPLSLGAIADHIGVWRAFGIVEPVLIALALLLLAAYHRPADRRPIKGGGVGAGPTG